MSSIEKSARNANQADLNELQAEYSRKKRNVVKENEAALDELQDYYNNKKSNLAEQNEAAISHIRKRSAGAIEHASEERTRLNQGYSKKLQEMQNEHDQKISSIRENRGKQLEQARQLTQQEIRDFEKQTEQKIEQVRLETQENLAKAKEKYQQEYQRTTSRGEQRVASQRKQNEETIHFEVERGRNAIERLRTNNEKEHSELYARGEKKINETAELQNNKLKRLNEDAAESLERQEKQWVSKEQRLQNEYVEKTTHNKQALQDELKNQNKRFQSLYTKNEHAQKESLGLQQQRYAKQLNETRKDFMVEASRYNDKADDPFYKIEDRGSYIRENPDFYILRAYVPEHEKDSVKVTIQNDKATISGQRSFKDKVEEDGKTITGATFQTFREEFPFEKPVITEGMTRERQGDWVVYTIPKGLSNRFNRKA